MNYSPNKCGPGPVAGGRCEYCLVPAGQIVTEFEIEHIIALKHRGPTALGNLAYACLKCNRHKGTDLASFDRKTSRTKLVRLFNPRLHRWAFHFRTDGARIVGRTPIGRVTVHVLALNQPNRIAIRAELIEDGFWPPVG